MKRYLGTKIVNMTPMNRSEYNIFRGWELPADENGSDEGYLVEYLDGGKPNTPHYAGYVSWSPKKQAEDAYRQVDGMTFGLALEALKKGLRVARSGWNGANQFVVCMPALYLPPFNSQAPWAKVNDRTAEHIGEDTPLDSQPYLALKNAQGKWQPGWVPSMGDLFAEDWVLA